MLFGQLVSAAPNGQKNSVTAVLRSDVLELILQARSIETESLYFINSLMIAKVSILVSSNSKKVLNGMFLLRLSEFPHVYSSFV